MQASKSKLIQSQKQQTFSVLLLQKVTKFQVVHFVNEKPIQ